MELWKTKEIIPPLIAGHIDRGFISNPTSTDRHLPQEEQITPIQMIGISLVLLEFHYFSVQCVQMRLMNVLMELQIRRKLASRPPKIDISGLHM